MTNKKKLYSRIMALLIAYLFGQTCNAQTSSIKPFPGEDKIISKLFDIAEPVNYHFTIELPDANFMIIEWNHLSDWQQKDNVKKMISMAKTCFSKVEDSFKGSTSAKRMDIHIPIENEPVTVRFHEYDVSNNVLLIKGNLLAPLKVNMDTLRLLKTTGKKAVYKQEQLEQVQYTFLLKDISQIKNIGNNDALIENIANTIDSIVNKHRDKWHNQNLWNHNLTVTYHPLSDDSKKRLISNDPVRGLHIKKITTIDEDGRYYKALDGDENIGITLFRNSLCPYIDLGFAYKWPVSTQNYAYVKAFFSGFNEFTPDKETLNLYGFVNVEFGIWENKKNTTIPVYLLSLGIGHDLGSFNNDNFDPQHPINMFRLFVNIKPSKLFTITPEFYYYKGIPGSYGITTTMRISS